MCSTPRSSGSVTKIRRLSTSSSHIRSDLQMMRSASDLYERKLAERAEKRARKALEQQLELTERESGSATVKNTADNALVSREMNHSIIDRFKRIISHYVHLMGAKITPITTKQANSL